MTPKPQETDRLPEQFAHRFLETHGAVVEPTDAGCHAVLPENLSGVLGVPEFIHVYNGQAADSAPVGSSDGGDPAYGVHYGAPLLDKMVDIAHRSIPVLSYQIHFDYIKSQGFNRLMGEQFSFPNAVGRVKSHAVVIMEYLILTCWYIAQSDEQKEGLVSLAFNMESGACIPDLLESTVDMNRTLDKDMAANGVDAAHVKEILQRAQTAFKDVIEEDTAAFQESMNRRFKRDVNNLTEYYDSLKQEMKKSLERPGLSRQLIDEREEKISLIPEELARKKDDLLKKYSIKISARPCTMMRIKTRAVKLLNSVSIGRAHKTLSMVYNPVTKAMDPLVCQGCGSSTYRCTFCSQLHLLCPKCSKKCPVCQ